MTRLKGFCHAQQGAESSLIALTGEWTAFNALQKRLESLAPSLLEQRTPPQIWLQTAGPVMEGQIFQTQRCPKIHPKISPAGSAQCHLSAAAALQKAAAACIDTKIIIMATLHRLHAPEQATAQKRQGERPARASERELVVYLCNHQCPAPNFKGGLQISAPFKGRSKKNIW